ncbi:TPA: hypothetical protein ACG3O0_000167 [Clostridioides difficile]
MLVFSPYVFQFILYCHWLDKYHEKAYTFMFIYQLVILVIGIVVALSILRSKNKSKAAEKTFKKRCE